MIAAAGSVALALAGTAAGLAALRLARHLPPAANQIPAGVADDVGARPGPEPAVQPVAA